MTYPPFPEDELRAQAKSNKEAHAKIDALRDELSSEKPSAKRIKEHVEHLNAWDDLVATLERWWMDPRTQTFIWDLTEAGL
jgi:hypothetical protein